MPGIDLPKCSPQALLYRSWVQVMNSRIASGFIRST